MLAHCIYYVVFVVARISFEHKPPYYVVLLEYYMDVIYFIDMIRNFTQPFVKGSRIVYNRKDIAKNYLLGWFLLDLYSFYPLAYFRFHSKWEEGGKDDVNNFMTQNFQRLPRFYKIMLLMQMGRSRDVNKFTNAFLKWLDFRIEY